MAEKKKSKQRKTITFYASCDCGCCTDELRFFSLKSAKEALAKVGLGNSQTIIDDLGVEHIGIDTFYGFGLNE